MANEKEQSTSVVATDTKATFKSYLVKSQDIYLGMVTTQMEEYKLELSNYQRNCVLSALGKINDVLSQKGLLFKDVDQSNLGQILTTVATLKLNPSATPREVYFQLRNVKVGDDWKKVIEMGIEGAGNDAILRNYGVNVKSVMTPFLIREGDDFSYPYFDGEKMCPITWHPKSYYGKIIRVVYVINKTDGTTDYAISEREEVANNLKAHIINNLRSVPEDVKNPILEKIENMTLDELLNDTSLRKVSYKDKTYNKETKTYDIRDNSVSAISPAWYQSSSREAMIERKMRNNAIKKYPKNFDNALAQNGYESTYDDYDQYREKKAAPNPIDVVDAEFEENKATTKANPILMTNCPSNEQIVHNEPKNEQIGHDSQQVVDENPY